MPTRRIALKEYCPSTKLLSVKDMVAYHVQIEDDINHANDVGVQLPYYSKEELNLTPASAYVFARQIIMGLLP